MTFLNLKKAYGNKNWNKMFVILKRVELKYGERKVIYNLYTNQTAKITIGQLQYKNE